MQQITAKIAEMDRLVQVAHRFAKICKNNPVKLFSLLYLLDIKHFREAGQSCTGETYYAMADGPAPGTLRSLLVMRDLDLDAGIGILTATSNSSPWRFDPHPYCKRALEIMQELEARYQKTATRDLRLDDGNAWWKVYTKGVGAIIPYEMTLTYADYAIGSEKSIERMGYPLTAQQRQSISSHSVPKYAQLY